MKPVNVNDINRPNSVNYDPYYSEIESFLDSGAEAAEVWSDPDKGVVANRERYHRCLVRVCRRRNIDYHDITISTVKSQFYLIRRKPKWKRNDV